MRFVIVNEGQDCVITDEGPSTTGNLGVISEDNVYLRAYAAYRDKRPTELEVGQRCKATFRLSGKGTYDVVRVA